MRQDEKEARSWEQGQCFVLGEENCSRQRVRTHPNHGRPSQIQRLKATEGRGPALTGTGIPSDLGYQANPLEVNGPPWRSLSCPIVLTPPRFLRTRPLPPGPRLGVPLGCALIQCEKHQVWVWVQASWWGASSISMRKVSMGVSPMSLKKNRCSRHLRPMDLRAGRRSSSLANRPCCSGYFCLQ